MEIRQLACSILMFAAAIPLAAAFSGDVRASIAGRGEPPTLKEAANGKLLIGTAAMSSHLADAKAATFVAAQFSAITPENEMKPDQVQPRKGEFTFDKCDKFVAFARQHGLKLIGHTLVWHSQAPNFLYADDAGRPLPRAEALANMKAHILAVAGHFRGNIHSWDVVNEALSDTGDEYLRQTPALKAIGADYLVKAFQFAHEADPGAELYYNDYNIETGEKAQKVLRLVKELKAAGAPIAGVGLQGHFLLDWPAVAEVEKTVSALKDLGMKVSVSELDIDPLPRERAGADIAATEKGGAANLDPYRQGFPAEVSERLAKRYGELFAMFANHPEIERVTFWGLDDGHSWLNNYPVRGRTNHPLLFDREGKPKPAFDAVVQELCGR